MPPGEKSRTRRDRTLVLDFDGTVCLGDGPIWAYADGVLPALSPEVADGVRAALRDYLAGESGADLYPDGYAALARLVADHVGPQVLEQAYAASRSALLEPGLDIHAPDGLAEVLDELADPEVGGVHRVLVTNAPDTGLEHALDRLGLTGRIDEIVPSANKPDGFAAIADRLLAGNDAITLMSVGDIWRNDIEPALAVGCAAGYIDRSGTDHRPAHVRVRTIQQLYPALLDWARSPADFIAAHRPELTENPLV